MDDLENSGPLEVSFQNAKSLLLITKEKGDTSMYARMVAILNLILKYKDNCGPKDIDYFYRLSHFSSEDRKDLFRADDEIPFDVLHAMEMQKMLMFRPVSNETNTNIPNLFQINKLFRHAGFGFDHEECLILYFQMIKLSNVYPNENQRFWGKLFGIKRSYYVVEMANFQSWPTENSSILSSPHSPTMITNIPDSNFSHLPNIKRKPVNTCPKEHVGSGVNRHAYFVCNGLGSDWVMLPPVEPDQIVCARKIRQYFTGHLDEKVVSLSPSLCREKNLLRAQIARISATTLISPINFYRFGEDDELDNDELDASNDDQRDNFVKNEEYEPLTVMELADPSITSWAHHSAYLLRQGTTKWISQDTHSVANSEVANEDSELEEDETEPETGPPLLTPISEDSDIDGMPPWSTQMSSSKLQQFALAVLSSNLWPGAYALSDGGTFENVYIGWGQKYLGSSFDPCLNLKVSEEFPSGPETTEIDDPTIDEEEAWKAAHAELHEDSELRDESESDAGTENDEDDDD